MRSVVDISVEGASAIASAAPRSCAEDDVVAVLALLHRFPERAWTLERISDYLKLSEGETARSLLRIARQGSARGLPALA